MAEGGRPSGRARARPLIGRVRFEQKALERQPRRRLSHPTRGTRRELAAESEVQTEPEILATQAFAPGKAMDNAACWQRSHAPQGRKCRSMRVHHVHHDRQ